MEDSMHTQNRRTFLQWLLSVFPAWFIASCGTSQSQEPTTSKKNNGNTTTANSASKTAALKAVQWLEQHKETIHKQNHRVWFALLHHELQFPAKAKQEWLAAWQQRSQSINERTTLGYLFIIAGLLGINLANTARDEQEKNVAQQFFDAPNTDATYQVDDFLLRITRGQSARLIEEITTTGLSDTQQGTKRLDVSALIAFFILIYNNNLTNEQITKLQKWANDQWIQHHPDPLTEKALLLAILKNNNGRNTYSESITTMEKEILEKQHQDGLWRASADDNENATEAHFLLTATVAMAIAMS
jgi:hypothetical protein